MDSEAMMKPIALTAAEAKGMLDRGNPIVFVDARNPIAWAQSKEKLHDAVRVPVDAVTEHLKDPRVRGVATRRIRVGA